MLHGHFPDFVKARRYLYCGILDDLNRIKQVFEPRAL